ncbi:MAG: hypothetical protein WA966_06145 [Ornithinimicrobium sp.]
MTRSGALRVPIPVWDSPSDPPAHTALSGNHAGVVRRNSLSLRLAVPQAKAVSMVQTYPEKS